MDCPRCALTCSDRAPSCSGCGHTFTPIERKADARWRERPSARKKASGAGCARWAIGCVCVGALAVAWFFGAFDHIGRADRWTAIVMPNRRTPQQSRDYGPYQSLDECRPAATYALRRLHEDRCRDCATPKRRAAPECEGCDDRADRFGDYVCGKNCDKSTGMNVCDVLER